MTTDRLRLTRSKATDSAGVFAILGDPQTVEHNPSDRLEDRVAAADLVSRWARHRERPVLNLVYRFVPDVWARGFATEAASAVVSTALAEMPEETIVARVRPDNRSSRQVAMKVGLHRDATLDCQGEDGLDLVFRSPDTH